MAVARPSLGLVVPVYDEAERLTDYVKQLFDFAAELPVGSALLFVDDGSADGTPNLIDDLIADTPGVPARVLRRPHMGKGAAVSAGLRALRTDLAGFCDVDLSTPLDDFDAIARAAARSGGLAIGSRGLATSTLVRREGRVRESLGRVYNRLLQAVMTPGVVDTQCGAKVAPRRVWDALLPRCRERGYAWDAEVIAVARAVGVAVVEVPVHWRHDDRSKVKVGRDGLAMLAATPRIWRSARRAAPPVAGPISAPVSAPSGAATPGADWHTQVFDDANAATLAGADRSHWWFRSKAALVATALHRTVGPRDERGWLVDIGGGAGGVTALLGWPPDRVAVLEGNHALATQAHRTHGLAAVRTAADRVPMADGAAEVVCLLDVIEHLHDPIAALREAGRALAPDGRLVVTVPAHTWLWSAADEQLGHVRRYTRPALATELAASGFEPVLLTHVFSWLVPPVFLTRKLVGRGSAELGLDKTSFALATAAMVLTGVERQLLGRVGLPFGTSASVRGDPSPLRPVASRAGGGRAASAPAESRVGRHYGRGVLAGAQENATLRRTWTLFRAFQVEQTDPDRFYSLLADDSVRQLSSWTPLAGKRVLDVGGGPGYFGAAFRRAGATYASVDSDLGELSAVAKPGPGTVLGSSLALPVRDDAVDVCYSSNVLEHVPEPERMADEMVRVTRPGGVVFLSWTTWLSPWGGHETSPWHYLGGHHAARRFTRRNGRAPKNEYGRTLFAVSAQRMRGWVRRAEAAHRVNLLDALPRYHPRWAHWIAAVPGVREVACWNYVLVLEVR